MNSHEGIDNHPAEEFAVMYTVDAATIRSHALKKKKKKHPGKVLMLHSICKLS